MKYTELIALLTILVIAPSYPILAQTTKPSVAATKTATESATVTATTSPEEETEQTEIQDLKEKIATKVAELRKKNLKAIAGTITDIKNKTITIDTVDEGKYEINVDETLTNIYLIGTSKKEIKLTDLKKGVYIIVSGPIVDKTIEANSIYQDEEFIVRSGKIIEADKTDFSIKVTTVAKDSYTIDVESGTTQQLLNIKTLELERIGFSKIKEGDTIHFIAKKSAAAGQAAPRASAMKIVIIPQEFFQK